MEARRRNAASEKSPGGWSNGADPSTPISPRDEDQDGKNVYGKAAVGYSTGRLPPPRQRKQPPPSDFVCPKDNFDCNDS